MRLNSKIRNLLDWRVLHAVSDVVSVPTFAWVASGNWCAAVCSGYLAIAAYRGIEEQTGTKLTNLIEGHKLREPKSAAEAFVMGNITSMSDQLGIAPPPVVIGAMDFPTNLGGAILLPGNLSKMYPSVENLYNSGAQDELLGMIGHEMSHVKHKDNLYRALSKATQTPTAGIGIILLVATVQNIHDLTKNIVIAGIMLASKIAFAQCNRLVECRADCEAVEMGAGEGLAKLLLKAEKGCARGFLPSLFYPYPSDQKRIGAIQSKQAKLFKIRTPVGP